MSRVDVLIPTFDRTPALAVTLTTLAYQTFRDFRIVVSDQGHDAPVSRSPEIAAVVRLLRLRGHAVDLVSHVPRRGLAEHRQSLLEQSSAPFALFLDDDLMLDAEVLSGMVTAIEEERCGFVGCAVVGLSYLSDVRPQEQSIEFWTTRVQPEAVEPGTPAWERYKLHNAANLYHVAERLGLDVTRPRKYRVAWVGGCVLYDRAALRDVGAFQFWHSLPPDHCGEDVLAQLRVMARYGGCGLIPSGVYHQELPTTVVDRSVNAPRVLAIQPPAGTGDEALARGRDAGVE